MFAYFGGPASDPNAKVSTGRERDSLCPGGEMMSPNHSGNIKTVRSFVDGRHSRVWQHHVVSSLQHGLLQILQNGRDHLSHNRWSAPWPLCDNGRCSRWWSSNPLNSQELLAEVEDRSGWKRSDIYIGKISPTYAALGLVQQQRQQNKASRTQWSRCWDVGKVLLFSCMCELMLTSMLQRLVVPQ